MQLCKGSFTLTVTNGYIFVLTMRKSCRSLEKHTTENLLQTAATDIAIRTGDMEIMRAEGSW